MRINNGLYEFNIVEYKSKRYEVIEVKDNKCKLKNNEKIIEGISVFECKKIES